MSNKLIVLIVFGVVLLAGFVYLKSNKKIVVQESKKLDQISSDFSGDFEIDPSLSSITWSASKTLIANYTDTGTIGVSSSNFSFIDGKLSAGSLNIDMNTISTKTTGKNAGMDGLTKHLKSADFFNVEKYPLSTFVISSTSIDGEKINITGDLTIKGITNSITFPAVIGMQDGALKAMADISLDRTLWDIRFGSGKFFQNLGDKVIDDLFTLKLDLTGKKK